MEVEAAMEVLRRGPRGGDLDAKYTKPEWKQAHFNGGATELHRADGWVETTAIGRKCEQPWHRMAAYMLVAGRTNSEIALAAEVTPSTVSTLRSQRWFQELLATIANQEGEDVVGVLKAEAQESLNVMVETRDDPTIPARLRYSAAKDLLELAHGKAVQRTVSISATTHFDSPTDEMETIKQELSALRER